MNSCDQFRTSIVRQEKSIQFPVADVETAKERLNEINYLENIQFKFYSKNQTIESCSIKKYPLIELKDRTNSFVLAVDLAFSQHRPLVISPDMIWLLICQGFSKHINQNPEKYRNVFVNHEGKKVLKIKFNFPKGFFYNPWEEVFDFFSKEIKKEVKKNITDLIVQNFSTTSMIEKAAFDISLMESMERYFDYRGKAICGIPYIILEGTVEDWDKIYRLVDEFNQYDLEWWVKELKPILYEFKMASEGKILKKFWKGIYNSEKGYGGNVVNGWIINFFPYTIQDGNTLMKNRLLGKKIENKHEGFYHRNFPSGISKVEFIWEIGKIEYQMNFLAGFTGIYQNDKLELRPEIGWVVKDCTIKKE